MILRQALDPDEIDRTKLILHVLTQNNRNAFKYIQ